MTDRDIVTKWSASNDDAELKVGDRFTITRKKPFWRRQWARLTRRPLDEVVAYVVTATARAGDTITLDGEEA